MLLLPLHTARDAVAAAELCSTTTAAKLSVAAAKLSVAAAKLSAADAAAWMMLSDAAAACLMLLMLPR